MIKVVGNKNCNRCEIIKNLFKQKNIDFEYLYLSDLDKKEQEKLLKEAEDKGLLNFPIIIKNDNIIDAKEIL